MGITGLYGIIGDGEVWPLAEYAGRHFEQHKRPLRIAVDEACWRFTNLTPEQVQKIREGEPAANPVEKVILWRIIRLLRLNVQLLFVNDGPKRPWKRNKRGGGLLDRELLRLTRKLLQQLKVPYHEAPGEAEAECAKLQALGVVDAVWSDDGDALMFGCTTLIRQHKAGNERVKDYIRVYEASALQEKYGLDVDGLVLFAVLAGGDYDTTGLKGCGSSTAHKLARAHVGLSKALRNTSEATLPVWRALLEEKLLEFRISVQVPYDFPMWRALNYYRNPTVSSPEQLRDLRGLRSGWDRTIDQIELRTFLHDRFHFTTREFLKHIAPIFVARRLARAQTGQRDTNLELGIVLKRTRKKQDGENLDDRTEANITFSPLPVVDIDLSQRPPHEDWTKFAAKDGTPYDPTQSVECEMLRCFLKQGLPDGALETAKPPKRKRKTNEEEPSSTTPTPSRKQKRALTSIEAPNASTEMNEAEQSVKKSKKLPAKRKPLNKQQTTKAPSGKTESAISDNAVLPPSLPEAPVFRQPHGLLNLRASIINLCGDEEILVQSRDSFSSLQSTGKPRYRPPSPVAALDVAAPQDAVLQIQQITSAPQLVPGESISPKTLRELRAAAFLTKEPNNSRLRPPTDTTQTPASSGKSAQPDVIDLT